MSQLCKKIKMQQKPSYDDLLKLNNELEAEVKLLRVENAVLKTELLKYKALLLNVVG